MIALLVFAALAAPASVEGDVLAEVNALRARSGLSPLTLVSDPTIAGHAQSMVRRGLYHVPGHTENVAQNYSARGVVRAWANSSGHRANILSSSTTAAVGVAWGSGGKLFVSMRYYGSSGPNMARRVTVSRARIRWFRR
jgi:uncharacterized protein YkwD